MTTYFNKRFRLFVVAENQCLFVTDTREKIGWNVELVTKKVNTTEPSEKSKALFEPNQKLIDLRKCLSGFGCEAILETDDLTSFIDNEDLFEIERNGFVEMLC